MLLTDKLWHGLTNKVAVAALTGSVVSETKLVRAHYAASRRVRRLYRSDLANFISRQRQWPRSEPMKPFDEQGVFGPDTIRILDAAHRNACERIRRERLVTAGDRRSIAARLLALARTGERDVDSLARQAVYGQVTEDDTME